MTVTQGFSIIEARNSLGPWDHFDSLDLFYMHFNSGLQRLDNNSYNTMSVFCFSQLKNSVWLTGWVLFGPETSTKYIKNNNNIIYTTFIILELSELLRLSGKFNWVKLILNIHTIILNYMPNMLRTDPVELFVSLYHFCNAFVKNEMLSYLHLNFSLLKPKRHSQIHARPWLVPSSCEILSSC